MQLDFSLCGKNLIGIVFDDEQYWRIDAVHAAVESVEAEAVMLGAVEQAPWTALGTRRQVKAQLQQASRTWQTSPTACNSHH